MTISAKTKKYLCSIFSAAALGVPLSLSSANTPPPVAQEPTVPPSPLIKSYVNLMQSDAQIPVRAYEITPDYKLRIIVHKEDISFGNKLGFVFGKVIAFYPKGEFDDQKTCPLLDVPRENIRVEKPSDDVRVSIIQLDKETMDMVNRHRCVVAQKPEGIGPG